MTSTTWSEATVRAFRDAVGDQHVVVEASALARASRTTFGAAQRVAAIVRPGSTDEVAECLRLANRLGVTLSPVSCGRNWGLGSALPASDGCGTLDLSRLDRIVAFDEELAFVTVEPGVTFAALHDFLRARGSRLFASTTGGSPRGSVLANALERGDGSGPLGDRFAHVCALQVVLATGEIVGTGFSPYGENRLAPLHRWGVGPSLDGLFSQSPFGVVTRMTVWLQPLPDYLAAVRFRLTDTAALGAVADAVRRLRLDGTLRSAVGFSNDYRVASTTDRYPFERAGGVTPLPANLMSEIRDSWGGARWFALTSIYSATALQGRAHVAHLRDVLGPLVRDLAITERAGLREGGHERVAEVDPGLSFLMGVPHEGSLRSVYWRKRAVPDSDLDPDRDACGVIWACPLVPLRGEDVTRAVTECETTFAAHAFDPLLAVVVQTDRTAFLVPLLVYDRETPGADAAAMACHDDLLARLGRAGYLPHRLGIQSMSAMPIPVDATADLLAKLEAVLDPRGVLSPGRYERT